MTDQTNTPSQEPQQPFTPQPAPPPAFAWPPQTPYAPMPPKDDIPDAPPVDTKIGTGFFSLIPRVLRLQDAMYFDIKDDKTSYRTISNMALIALGCFMIYGFIMGTYNHFPWQSISSMIKLPIVFLISLAVCLLPLYLIGILLNLRMYFRQITGLFVMGVCASSLVAVCLAPIMAFCLITVSSNLRYEIMMMVNVGVLGIAGVVGVAYVLRGSKFMAKKRQQETGQPFKRRKILWLWMLVYALVGIQLAWDLKPYMGKEGLPFEVIRRGSIDFYSSTIIVAKEILGIIETPLERAESRKKSLDRQIASDREKVEELTKEIAPLEAELKTMQANPQRDEEDYKSKQAHLKDLKEQLTALQSKLEAEKKERESLERSRFPSS